MTARRPPIFGPEPWAEHARARWSHWDLWFCLVGVTEADGDWAALEEAIITRDRKRSVGSWVWERKRSHLLDLQARLDAAGLTAADLARDHLDDKQLLGKARRKVLDQELADRDLTPAMNDTPRRRLRGRAMRGHWDRFPVSPEADEADFADWIESDGRSFWLATELEAYATEQHVARASDPAGQMALWRGLLTAGLEAFRHGLRDSLGVFASFLGEAFETYSSLPWRDTDIDPAIYWADLCQWCIWEDYGIRPGRDAGTFRSARLGEVELIEALLVDLEAEHRSHRLDYEAAQALQLVARLAVATNSFDRFVTAAERLGSEMWMEIDALGQAATEAGRLDLAVEVYGAAIAGDGWNTDHLTRLCRQRTGRDPTPPRHLRSVE